MKKRIYAWGAISLVILSLFFLTGFMVGDSRNVQTQELQPISVGEQIPPIKGHVDAYLVRDGEIIIESHGHNVFYNDGLEAIETWAADGVDTGPYTNISICNASTSCGTPVAAGTEDFTAYAGCGLESVQGTVTDNGVGNVTISNTFTIDAGCSSIDINVTRLTNTTGGLWAGKVLDTPITGATGGDDVILNWTWWGVSA